MWGEKLDFVRHIGDLKNVKLATRHESTLLEGITLKYHYNEENWPLRGGDCHACSKDVRRLLQKAGMAINTKIEGIFVRDD
jgi:hypothetical protein